MDGTIILLWREGWDVLPFASWGDYPYNPVVDSEDREFWLGGWVFSEFLALGVEEGFLGWDIDPMPTYWMPLPEAPTVGEI
jgi:hypothetical protein